MAVIEEKGPSSGNEDYTQDGTVDLKGRPVLRSKTGKWKACSFIVGYEVFERMAFYGIQSNLVIYLTNKLHEGTVTASNNVSNWVGAVWMMPLAGAYIADAHLGRYKTFVIASCIYILVYVAAGSNWKLHVPDDPKELHELSIEEYASNGRNRIDRSSSLSFLDKAAIKTGQTSPWMLCTVTQVEETKQMTKLIPLLLTTIIPSTLVVQASTLFVKQGTTLDRSMGPHFQIPPACLNAFVTISMLITIVVYDRAFVPAIRRYTKNPRGITMLQRLGIGLVMHVFIMVIACFAERRRLKVARENHLFGLHDTIPLTIFILLPQYALGGVADNFVEVAKIEIFYDQAPDGMKSLGTAYFTTTLGIGSFLSSFLLSTVADVTKRHGHNGWILNNLNVSRLDYYYAFMAVLSFLNFLCFLVVAKFFVYNVDVTQTKSGSEINPSSSQEQDNTGISPSIPQPDGKS
ncbi:hypothetical protein JHK87_053758 [Glycine soja]|nr:hypothetical protein JHK87_053758 [Glycine soja]